jgi:SAM-dependent methyltransferase
MRSEQLDLQQYATDKVRNGYLRWYDAAIGDAWERVTAVLELGVHRGGSLELWRDYFPNARVIGIDADVSAARVADRTRIEIFEARQDDAEKLREIAARTAPDGFDLIVDDASHIAKLSEPSFRALYDAHLKPGGLYVIEDWATGYLPEWPDGKQLSAWRSRSHESGMVGWVKRLIDAEVRTRLAEMTITPGLVVLRKPR